MLTCLPAPPAPVPQPGAGKRSLRCLFSPQHFRSAPSTFCPRPIPPQGCPSWVASVRPAATLGTLSGFLRENLLRLRVPSPTWSPLLLACPPSSHASDLRPCWTPRPTPRPGQVPSTFLGSPRRPSVVPPLPGPSLSPSCCETAGDRAGQALEGSRTVGVRQAGSTVRPAPAGASPSPTPHAGSSSGAWPGSSLTCGQV